jgi:phospholipid/cholesterol/gamma-HCH transport system ATP-binding protein
MIEIRHLSKAFDGRPVLRDVSLEIHEGETFAVIGRSGSGKSVLLKHLIGLLKPDAGEVVVDGERLADLPYWGLRRARRLFGVLFQGGALFDSLSALENVEFPLRTFSDLPEKELRARALACLEMVELPDAAAKKPAELSGGMQKRVALARAIAVEPKYILYDEPTSGLDPETSNTIDVNHTIGATSVVVTHDMHSVLNIADRVGFVHEGRLHWTGTVEELHTATDPELCRFVRANEYQIGVRDPASAA